MPHQLVYIHGFLSGPESHKAQQVKRWSEERDVAFHCPALSAHPGEAIANLEVALINLQMSGAESIGLIGSSLGGYYATYLTEKYPCRALLVNPAVKPYELITAYLDQPLKNYYSEATYTLSSKDMDALKQLEVATLTRHNRLWLLAQEGDETLDYRQAVERYAGCQQTIEPAGDHSFQGFERYRDSLFEFLFPETTTN